MRVIASSADRGPLISTGVVFGALALVSTSVLTGRGITHFVPLAAVAIVITMSYRVLLAWRTQLAFIIVIILAIPIRRYEMPGNLPFQLEPYRLAVALVTVGWFASLLADPRVRLRRSPLDAPLFAVLLSAALSVIVNGSRVSDAEVGPAVWKKLTFLVSYMLVFYLVISLVKRFDDVVALVRILVGGGAIISVLSLVEFRTGFNAFDHLANVIPFLQLTDVLSTEDIARGGKLRVYASAQHPIALGAMLVMLIPLAIYLARSSKNRAPWIASAGLLFLGALTTISRTAVIMMLVIGVIYLWLRPRETKRLWPLLIPALLVTHLALPGTIGTLKDAFFPQGGLIAQQKVGAGGSGSGRVADLGPNLAKVAEHPVFGQGFGTRVVDGPNPNAPILDDQWLGTLVETGLLGAAAWIWLFVSFVRRLGLAAKRDLSDRGWLLAGMAASVAAFAVGMLTYDAFSFIQATFTMFILLALGCAALTARDGSRRAIP
jgi:O-Antigen ligase